MSSNRSPPAQDLDPDVLEEDGVGEALETLDGIFERYDEDVSLEVAEDTYADVAEGIGSYHRMTFYVDEDLEELKRDLPGSVFSRLPDDHDAYELQDDDVTLRLKFDERHDESVPVETSYDNVDVAVPTEEAYMSRFYDEVTDRMED